MVLLTLGSAASSNVLEELVACIQILCLFCTITMYVIVDKQTLFHT
jgi:hypothetical protein